MENYGNMAEVQLKTIEESLGIAENLADYRDLRRLLQEWRGTWDVLGLPESIGRRAHALEASINHQRNLRLEKLLIERGELTFSNQKLILALITPELRQSFKHIFQVINAGKVEYAKELWLEALDELSRMKEHIRTHQAVLNAVHGVEVVLGMTTKPAPASESATVQVASQLSPLPRKNISLREQHKVESKPQSEIAPALITEPISQPQPVSVTELLSAVEPKIDTVQAAAVIIEESTVAKVDPLFDFTDLGKDGIKHYFRPVAYGEPELRDIRRQITTASRNKELGIKARGRNMFEQANNLYRDSEKTLNNILEKITTNTSQSTMGDTQGLITSYILALAILHDKVLLYKEMAVWELRQSRSGDAFVKEAMEALNEYVAIIKEVSKNERLINADLKRYFYNWEIREGMLDILLREMRELQEMYPRENPQKSESPQVGTKVKAIKSLDIIIWANKNTPKDAAEAKFNYGDNFITKVVNQEITILEPSLPAVKLELPGMPDMDVVMIWVKYRQEGTMFNVVTLENAKLGKDYEAIAAFRKNEFGDIERIKLNIPVPKYVTVQAPVIPKKIDEPTATSDLKVIVRPAVKKPVAVALPDNVEATINWETWIQREVEAILAKRPPMPWPSKQQRADMGRVSLTLDKLVAAIEAVAAISKPNLPQHKDVAEKLGERVQNISRFDADLYRLGMPAASLPSDEAFYQLLTVTVARMHRGHPWFYKMPLSTNDVARWLGIGDPGTLIKKGGEYLSAVGIFSNKFITDEKIKWHQEYLKATLGLEGNSLNLVFSMKAGLPWAKKQGLSAEDIKVKTEDRLKIEAVQDLWEKIFEERLLQERLRYIKILKFKAARDYKIAYTSVDQGARNKALSRIKVMSVDDPDAVLKNIGPHTFYTPGVVLLAAIAGLATSPLLLKAVIMVAAGLLLWHERKPLKELLLFSVNLFLMFSLPIANQIYCHNGCNDDNAADKKNFQAFHIYSPSMLFSRIIPPIKSNANRNKPKKHTVGSSEPETIGGIKNPAKTNLHRSKSVFERFLHCDGLKWILGNIKEALQGNLIGEVKNTKTSKGVALANKLSSESYFVNY